jgi:hypothetical protein
MLARTLTAVRHRLVDPRTGVLLLNLGRLIDLLARLTDLL